MKLKVEQVYPSNPPIAACVWESSHEQVNSGDLLRCGGYRYLVERVTQHGEQVQLTLSTYDAVRPGMVLRKADEPTSDEELCSMLARASQILFQLHEMDVTNTLLRLRAASEQQGSDPLCNALGNTLNTAVAVFDRLHTMRQTVPHIKDQRAFTLRAKELVSQMRVMELDPKAHTPTGG